MGFTKRKELTIKARCAFNVYKHYELIFEEGSKAQKDKLIHNLRRIAKTHTRIYKKAKKGKAAKTKTIEFDPDGLELWNKYKEKSINLKSHDINE